MLETSLDASYDSDPQTYAAALVKRIKVRHAQSCGRHPLMRPADGRRVREERDLVDHLL
jgi:hypothetical protein